MGRLIWGEDWEDVYDDIIVHDLEEQLDIDEGRPFPEEYV